MNTETIIETIEADTAYEYQNADLPDGWELAVWPDGRAMVLSPRCSVKELGGYSSSYELLDAERLQRYGLQTERHRELKEMAKADVGITAEEYSLAYCASPVRVERLDVR